MNTVKKIILGILYWIVQLTWGSLMTVVGLLVTGFCIIFLKGTPHRNGFSYIVEIGGNWGGLELGAVALCGRYNTKGHKAYSPNWFQETRRHEFGHTLQNLIFGPFTLFVVGLPSAIRYHYKRIAQKRGKRFPSDWYDSVWFEGTATRWGTKAIRWIESANVKPESKPTVIPQKPIINTPIYDSSMDSTN